MCKDEIQKNKEKKRKKKIIVSITMKDWRNGMKNEMNKERFLNF